MKKVLFLLFSFLITIIMTGRNKEKAYVHNKIIML